MKLLAVVLLLTAVVYVQGQLTKEKVTAFANDCKAETGATDADVQDVFKKAPAASKEAKCLRACMMKKGGVLSNDGKLLKDASIDIAKVAAKGDAAKEQKGIEVVNTCAAAKVANDACEAAEQYSACFVKQAAAKGLTA